jgi:hypothetical protein
MGLPNTPRKRRLIADRPGPGSRNCAVISRFLKVLRSLGLGFTGQLGAIRGFDGVSGEVRALQSPDRAKVQDSFARELGAS